MPRPKLAEFLTDPKYKEESDFFRGVIDARVKELKEQYEAERGKKKKKKQDDVPDDDDNGDAGSFWDELFGGEEK